MALRSLFVAYVLYFTSAPFGLHLLYVGRERQAFVWAITFGGFGIGILRDFFVLRRYVREANGTEKIENGNIPRLSIFRILLQAAMGYYIAILLAALIPPPLDGQVLDIKYKVLSHALYAVGLSMGLTLAGSVGNEAVSFLSSFKVAISIAFIHSLVDSNLFSEQQFSSELHTIQFLSALALSVRSRKYSESNQVPGKSYWHVWKTTTFFIKLWMFTVLMCISLYNHGEVHVTDEKTGEKVHVPLKTMFDDFPSFEEISSIFTEANWEKFREALHEFSSKTAMSRAYEVLELPYGASQQEVKKKFRELSVKYHPDRNRGESKEKQQAVEEHYLKITEAYEAIKASFK